MTVSLLLQMSDSYVTDAGLWSLAGFIGGYVVGRIHHRLIRKKERRERAT